LLVDGPGIYESSGVLSGPKTAIGFFFGRLFGKTELVSGYAVNSRVAIEILENNHQETAHWWKENTTFYSNEEQAFIFDEEACEVYHENG
jgi:hypothetical protein